MGLIAKDNAPATAGLVRPARPPLPWRPNPEAIPDELRKRDRWVPVRGEWVYQPERQRWKLKKTPQARGGGNASCHRPATWYSFEDAATQVETLLGTCVPALLFYATDTTDGLVYGDLDGVLDPVTGDIDAQAAKDVAAFGYVERSASGTGLRWIAAGEWPHGNAEGADNVRAIHAEGFISVTGNVLDINGTCRGEVVAQPEAIQAFGRMVVASKKTNGANSTAHQQANGQIPKVGPAPEVDVSKLRLSPAARGLLRGDLPAEGARSDAVANIANALASDAGLSPNECFSWLCADVWISQVALEKRTGRKPAAKEWLWYQAQRTEGRARPSRRKAQIEVLSVGELRQRPRPAWLVRGLLQAAGLVVVFGASGAGKTFVVLDMALAIVRGVRWMGRRVKRGNVVYVASEGGLRLRLEAYMHHHRVAEAELDGFAVVEQSVNLLDKDGDLDSLVTAIREATRARSWDGVNVVVVDTLNRAMPGGNENASEDMSAMVAAAKQMEQEFGCVVVFVHHSGKDESKGSRGHSSLKAATDAEIAVKVVGENVRTVIAEKVREAESGAKLAGFTLEQVDLGATRDHDPDADADERDWSCVVVPCDVPEGKRGDRLKDTDRLALTYLHRTLDTEAAMPPAGVYTKAGKSRPKSGTMACRVEAWRDHAVKAGGLSSSDKPATHRQAFHRCRKALESAGAIGVFDDWVWLRDTRDTPRQQ